MLRKVIVALLVVGLVLTGFAGPAEAQRRMSLIRDAEIEHTIRRFLEPILQVAGVSPGAVDIILVNDPTLNAFVSGGQNIFIHTGLLMEVETPGELIGVLAHETGHIAGGHLARGQDALENAQRTALLTTLLGIAAAVASGEGGAGAAVMMGGQSMAQRDFLGFTRGMESAADQAAMSYLDRVGYSSEGLLTFLEQLADQELVPESRQVEYVRTHPLTQDRVATVRHHVQNSPLTGEPYPAGYVESLARIQAKLYGFLMPQVAMRRYPETDTSFAGHYGRTIAQYRRGDFDAALAGIDALIGAEPQNPYFHELKGQILLETGRLEQAREPYERAVELLPREPLLLVALAQTKLEGNDETLLRSAIANLEEAVRQPDGDTPLAWRLLATGYGKVGELGMAAVALAEEALARGDREGALAQADRAQQILPAGSPGALRAQDIERAAEQLEEEDDR